jgi:hypothetical protein
MGIIIDKFFGNKSPKKVAESEKFFEKYTLFWTIFSPNIALPIPSKTADLSYPVHSEQYFPVYISGKELDEFEKNGTFSLAPLNLIAGALLGYRYRPHVPIGDVRPFLSQYLDRCSVELNDGNIDELVVQMATLLRGKNGNYASKLALSNALCLNTNHNKILNDLLLDVWACMNSASDKNLGSLFQEFHDCSKDMIMHEMHPGSVEWFIYARAVTLVYMQIHNMKFDFDLLGSINLVENELGRRKILDSLNSRHFDRNLI